MPVSDFHAAVVSWNRASMIHIAKKSLGAGPGRGVRRRSRWLDTGIARTEAGRGCNRKVKENDFPQLAPRASPPTEYVRFQRIPTIDRLYFMAWTILLTSALHLA